ncbi:MAG: DUF411 domain-containing protein [Methylococcaceae bacterium]|nr:DUF411 domain-containing protein [Methylococcaceae bacterium]
MKNSLLVLLLSLLSLNAWSVEPVQTEIKVYRSPTCQCCHKWINHLKENKFTVIDMLTNNMVSVKDAVELPRKMTSCHTAIIDGYIIEGHVPANDIRRLLVDKPDVAGLSVPQMPVGTPGMEIGERKDHFIVFQFNTNGQYSVFNQYEVDEHNQYHDQLSTEHH